MRQFASILVYCGTPQSNAQIQLVARLAASSGAHVTLADAMEHVQEETLRRLPENWDVTALVRAEKQKALGRLAARMRRAGVSPSTALVEGNLVDAVTDVVKGDEHDLLVIDESFGGYPDRAREIITRLLSESRIAILVTKNQRRRKHPRILAAVDESIWRPREADSLNSSLIEAALWFAKQLDGEIHVLHVWEPVAENSLRWAGVSAEGESEHHAAVQTDARQELEITIEPYRAHISAKHVHVETGDRRLVIPAFASDAGIDLIVVGNYARSGITGRLLGNAADTLLETSPCSILVIPRQRAAMPVRHDA